MISGPPIVRSNQKTGESWVLRGDLESDVFYWKGVWESEKDAERELEKEIKMLLEKERGQIKQ